LTSSALIPVFTYGQTSSGKTFTMQGNRASSKNDASCNGVDGIIHMAARDIFDIIFADPQHSYSVCVSFMEIYNEKVYDLLVDRHKQNPLTILQKPKSAMVNDLDGLFHYLNLGKERIEIGATGMNDQSSRSHTIFRITVEKRSENVGVKLVATLNLVDLVCSQGLVSRNQVIQCICTISNDNFLH